MSSSASIRLLSALCALALLAPAAAERRPSLRQLLAAQGFTAELNRGRVLLDELGAFDCTGRHLRVVFYQHDDPRSRRVQPQQHRLLFLDGEQYLGSYELDSRPTTIADDGLLFAHPLSHDERLRCDARGLPSSAVLDGELRRLAK